MNKGRIALQYGSNVPVRAALAIACLFWSVGLLMLTSAKNPQIYRLMSDTHPDWWAAVFAINSALLWWRIFDRRPRAHLGRLINALTSTLWLAVTISTIAGEGFLAAAGSMTFFLMSLWVSVRTDLTPSDKESV